MRQWLEKRFPIGLGVDSCAVGYNWSVPESSVGDLLSVIRENNTKGCQFLVSGL